MVTREAQKDDAVAKQISALEGLKGFGVLSRNWESSLPDQGWLDRVSDLKTGGRVADLLQSTLVEPVQYLTDRPGKNIRGKLVDLAFTLAHGDRVRSPLEGERCRLGADMVEFVHTGSLVVDDIEDGSQLRRGQPTLNQRFGLPIALNAGNWLYFWPLFLLGEMGLTAESELSIFRLYRSTLVRAHFGQALDLGVLVDSLPQKQISEVCLAAMELKTGALAAFSLILGGILGGASNRLLAALDRFGHGFGIALQMFDDLGNLSGRKDAAKRFEDLAFRKPGWAWAYAARNSSKESFDEWVAAVGKLPDEKAVVRWIERHELMERARRGAESYLNQVNQEFALHIAGEKVDHKAIDKLFDLGRTVANAYD